LFFVSCFLINNLQAESRIIINEIAWMGTIVSSSDEWIELKNMSNEDIDLSNWKLVNDDQSLLINLEGFIKAGEFFLLERGDDETVPKIEADLVYNGVLSNQGESLQLLDNNGELVDFVDQKDAWLAGDNSKKLTMEKIADVWQNSFVSGGSPFSENSSKDSSTSSEENILTNDDLDNEEELEEVDYKDKIFINEFLFAPDSGESEWIELYNYSSENICLDNFVVFDGSGVITVLKGNILAKNFFVIENKGKLNNSGDIIFLRDSKNKIVDQVAYGDWEGDDDNASIDFANSSLARISYDKEKDIDKFKSTTQFTKNAVNVIVVPTNEIITNSVSANSETKELDYSKNIIISEIFPNPAGPDFSEWIELENIGNKNFDLYGWRLENNNNQYEFDHQIINSKGFLVLNRLKTNLVLNNLKDKIKLYSINSNKIVDEAEYKEAQEDCSLVRDKSKLNNQWIWTKKITKNLKNEIQKINFAPIAYFQLPEFIKTNEFLVLDASDSFDINQDDLKYFWDFGNGASSTGVLVSFVYKEAGDFKIKLRVSDGKLENILEKKIKVEKNIEENSLIKNLVLENKSKANKIIISEFLPDPQGADSEGEWIELQNIDKSIIDLFNWSIDDEEGGSKPYKIKENIKLKPGEYFVIDRADSNIALNNSSDWVRVFDFDENLIDEVKYTKSQEGKSYIKNKDKWYWGDPSPLENNLFKTASVDFQKEKEIKKNNKQKNVFAHQVFLGDLKNFSKGERFQIKGIVNVLPNIFSSQYFYIEDETAGVQVYSYKKDFPNLSLGDLVLINGELSFIDDFPRIKTNTKNDIQIISKANNLLAKDLKIKDVNDNFLGKLIKIKGDLVDRKNDLLYIDDGESEIVAQIKELSGIDKKVLKEGSIIELSGILTKQGNDYRLLPRFVDDLVILETKKIDQGNILGAEENKSLEKFVLPTRKEQNIWHYAGGFLVFFVFMILALVVKKRILN